MSKEDVVMAGVAAIQTANVAALSEQLGLAFDGGMSEQKAQPVGEGQYSEEQVSEIKAEHEAKLADAHAQLTAAYDVIEQVKSDDEADKAAIADGLAKLEAIKLIVGPAVPVEQ